MNKTTILFDLDGTLIDSTEAILESFYYAFEDQKFSYKGTTQEIKDLIGYPLDVMFTQLGVSKNNVSDFVNSYKGHYREISEAKTLLLEDAQEAVKLASTFATLGVVTTKTTKYSIPLLKSFGLLEYFNVIIGRQEVEHPKPDPEPILKACEKLALIPNQNIYMIGDTKLDLIAANRAKVSSVGVLCGYGVAKELSHYSPNVVFNALEAIKLVKNLISKA